MKPHEMWFNDLPRGSSYEDVKKKPSVFKSILVHYNRSKFENMGFGPGRIAVLTKMLNERGFEPFAFQDGKWYLGCRRIERTVK